MILGLYSRHTFSLLLALIAWALPAFAQPADEEVEVFELPGGVSLEMVTIPPGVFTMGNENGQSDEHPARETTITRAFQLSKFELTKAQWEAVMGTRPWEGQQSVISDPDSPAVYLNYQDCEAFVAKINELTGETFRLPTEAEWEYACRAGTDTDYYFGNDPAALSDYAWWEGNTFQLGNKYAHRVGQKEPNAFGLYDMLGNAAEWCADYYGNGDYDLEDTTDPQGPESGFARVVRGGSWLSAAHLCTSSNREEYLPMPRRHDRTIRLARTLP